MPIFDGILAVLSGILKFQNPNQLNYCSRHLLLSCQINFVINGAYQEQKRANRELNFEYQNSKRATVARFEFWYLKFSTLKSPILQIKRQTQRICNPQTLLNMMQMQNFAKFWNSVEFCGIPPVFDGILSFLSAISHGQRCFGLSHHQPHPVSWYSRQNLTKRWNFVDKCPFLMEFWQFWAEFWNSKTQIN